LPALSKGSTTLCWASYALSAMTMRALMPRSRTSAPSRSEACPGVSRKPVGLPNASTVAWILVLRPPRLRPMACAEPPFGTAAVLVRSHDGRVDHGVLVVRVLGQGLENTLPHTAAAPSHMAQMHDAKIAEALGQVAPGNAGAVAIEHRIDEQPVVLGGGSNVSGPAGQQVLDLAPLAICQGISATHAPDNGASIRFDDTP